MPTKLVLKREELREKQAYLAKIFEAAGADMDLALVDELKEYKGTAAKAGEIKRLNTELTDLGKEVDSLAEIERTAAEVKRVGEQFNQPASGVIHPPAAAMGTPMVPQPQKSLGRLFVESPAFTEFQGKRSPVATIKGVEMKTLMTTSAGWAPQSVRMPGYVPSAQRIPTIVDIVPMNTTTQAAVLYMEETTFTNNAAARAEGANTAGEAALALTERTATVYQVAVWLPVTEQQMEDVTYMEGYVNNRLTLMLRQTLSAYLLTGTGVAPQIEGLLVNTSVLEQPKGADNIPDAVYKAMTQVRVTGRAEPNAAVFHPNDWQEVRLLKTDDGAYIWGAPMEAGPERIWGLQVIQDTAETETTGLVGDFANFCELVMRSDIEFETSNSHASYFPQFILAIRAGVRAAFPIYRKAAFCKATGL